MKISQIGILTAAVAWLLLSMADAWADDIEKQYADKEKELKEKQTVEEIVADTLSFEEYAEWTAIKQRFQARETKENERQLACVEKGEHPKQCVDPNWCLYPSNENKSECVKYNIKHGLF
jgi:hypothetical protein